MLQEIIFAHCPHDDLYPNQPCLQGNLLYRMDWLQLWRIAGTECAILPILEIAAHPRCCASQHSSSGSRPTARRSVPAPEPLSQFWWWLAQKPWCGSARRADSPSSGRTHSVYNSEPDLSFRGLARGWNQLLLGAEPQKRRVRRRPGRRRPLIKEGPALILPCVAQDNSFFAPPLRHSPRPTLDVVVFRFRKQLQQFPYVGARQTLGGGCPGASSSCAAADDSPTQPMVGHHRSTSTSVLNSMLINLLRGFGPKCSGKKSGSGLSSRKRSRAAGTTCQQNTRKRRKHAQYHREDRWFNRTSPSWRLLQPAPPHTVDPVTDERSLWDWLTTSTTKCTATQTSAPEADERSLQHWRSIQEKYWLELQRVQHSIQQTLEQSRDRGRRARARSPTAVLEQLLDRIRGCSGFPQTQAHRSTQKRRRRIQRRRRRSEKRGLQRHYRGVVIRD